MEVIAEKNEPNPCSSTANPVNFTTGNKHIEEVDLVAQGTQKLQFRRVWNSYNQQWFFSFRQYARITQTSQQTPLVHTVTIYHDTGRAVQFLLLSDQWVADPDVRDTLAAEGEQWLYTKSSGDKEWYDADGRLRRILRVNGNGVTITYPDTTTVHVADDYGNDMTLSLDAAGRVIAMTDPDGETYTYAYNTEGNLELVYYPASRSDSSPYRQYHYEDPLPDRDPDLVTGITDENGDVYKTITYDDAGRAIHSGLSDGTLGHSTFNYSEINNASDPRVTVTNSLGKDTTYHLEYHFGITKVVQVEGAAQLSTGCLADVQGTTYYPASGWVERKTDKAGNKTFYEYQSGPALKGLLLRRTEAEGSNEERVYEYDWYPSTRQMMQETLLGVKRTDFVYWPNGRLRTRTETDLTGLADVGTRIWAYTYTYHDTGADTQVRTMAVDGPRTEESDTTSTEYSEQGYVTKVTNALSHETVYRFHNGRGQPGEIVDANGVITRLEYNPRGWLDKITRDYRGLNAVTDLHYDNVGNLTGVTLADGVHIEFRFDAAHRLYETENDLGEVIKYELDAAGNQDEILYKDNQGTVVQTVDYDFDGLSRLWKEFGSYGQQTEYSYDEKDHLTTISDGVNPVSVQIFDTRNRLQQATDADSKDMFIEYDAEDRVKKVTDQRGLVTDYLYDGFGDLQTLASPDTGTTSYDYDEAGNRTQQTDARNVVSNYTYDALNRLKTATYPDATRNITYLYDNWQLCKTCNGRLAAHSDSSGQTAYIYDALGRIDIRINNVNVPGSPPVSLATNFDFNKAGRLEQVIYPNGQVVKYGLDAAGQVDAVSYEAEGPNNTLPTVNRSIATNIEYQPFGLMKRATYGNNLQLNRVYDQDGRLDTQGVTGVQSLDYGYDGVNNINDIDNLIDDSRDEEFTYDNLNRLDTASGKYGDIDYDYDAVGNREKRTIVRGTTTTVEDHQIDPASNRLDQIDIEEGTTTTMRQFEYDPAGNLVAERRANGTTMEPVYDDTNRMESVSQ